MDLLEELDRLGLVSLQTDGLPARLQAGGPITLYYGCDPTADSLHIGNLVGLLVLRRFQDAGHTPIALAGGATGMIGDPSGRSEERNLLDEATLASNVASIKQQIERVVDAELVDNYAWTRDVTLLGFLREIGKHAPVNQMLRRESVKARMESPHGISYTEFSYMLLQANDYLWLHEHRGCELQIGGSDQWGNILSGVDLIRRKHGATAHALAWPLLTDAAGSKLGKTAGARIWLDPDRTSPYQFFQHFMQAADDELAQLLAMFTLLSADQVDAVLEKHGEALSLREGQRKLAREVTTLVHGAEAAARAEHAAKVLFGGGVDGVDLETLTVIARETGATAIPASELAAGVPLADLVAATPLAKSKGEAERLVKQGGIRVNDVAAGAGRTVTDADLLDDHGLLLRRGKSAYHVVVRGE